MSKPMFMRSITHALGRSMLGGSLFGLVNKCIMLTLDVRYKVLLVDYLLPQHVYLLRSGTRMITRMRPWAELWLARVLVLSVSSSCCLLCVCLLFIVSL